MNVQEVVLRPFIYTKGYFEGFTILEFRPNYPLGFFYKLLISFVYVVKGLSFNYSNHQKFQPW